MTLPYLSLTDARNLHLTAQGLLNKPRRRALPEDIIATISRMSLLQIDTINIVARSPYLVLFSRLGNYSQQWLDESLARGELMEYWAHEASFMPRSDFQLIRHRMLAPEKMGWKYKDAWMQEHAAEIAQLIQHIQITGRYVQLILSILVKVRAAGGSGSRINVIWKGSLLPER
ncbi:putative cytoplasmic protein [Escherichia coli]|nr:putative cytoplasmic protein [Escherichia coli]